MVTSKYYCTIPRFVIFTLLVIIIISYTVFFILQPYLWDRPSLPANCTILHKANGTLDDARRTRYFLILNITLSPLTNHTERNMSISDVCFKRTVEERDLCANEFFVGESYDCYFSVIGSEVSSVWFHVELKEWLGHEIYTLVMVTLVVYVCAIVIPLSIFIGWYFCTRQQRPIQHFIKLLFMQELEPKFFTNSLQSSIEDSSLTQLVRYALDPNSSVRKLIAYTGVEPFEEICWCYRPPLKARFPTSVLFKYLLATILFVGIIVSGFLMRPNLQMSSVVGPLIPIYLIYMATMIIENFTEEYCLTKRRAIVLCRSILFSYKIVSYDFGEFKEVQDIGDAVQVVLGHNEVKLLFSGLSNPRFVADLIRHQLRKDTSDIF